MVSWNLGLVELLKWNRIDYENYIDLDYKEGNRCIQKIGYFWRLFQHTKDLACPSWKHRQWGRPIVTSNTASMPEVAGNGALLVDPSDVKAIREAIWNINT